jgi:hypothetical protein
MRQSFDRVWERISSSISRKHSFEIGRAKLADAVLRASMTGVVSAEDLTEKVLDIVFTPPTSI